MDQRLNIQLFRLNVVARRRRLVPRGPLAFRWVAVGVALGLGVPVSTLSSRALLVERCGGHVGGAGVLLFHHLLDFAAAVLKPDFDLEVFKFKTVSDERHQTLISHREFI